jgi:hypothetical protein
MILNGGAGQAQQLSTLQGHIGSGVWAQYHLARPRRPGHTHEPIVLASARKALL